MKILQDIFPAVVSFYAPDSEREINVSTTSDGYVDRARAIITENLVVIAVDTPTGPQIVFRESYETASFSTDSDKITRLTTENSKKLAIKRQEGCACGSRLRSWNPYKTLSS